MADRFPSVLRISQEDDPEVEVGLRKVRPDLGGRLKMLDDFRQRIGEILMGVGEIGIERSSLRRWRLFLSEAKKVERVVPNVPECRLTFSR